MEEIIIQGKPYSGSKIATKGLNPTLVDRIFKIFFDTMGGIRIEKALIVDTMYWDSKWYTVYTYSRYANITDKSDEDKAGRQSYFALSLIIPQAYLYLTSEVYKLLDKVYTETIEGVYISKSGKYLVQDFTNQDNFNIVVEKIKSEFAGSNLQDPIDVSFKKEHSAQDIRYNVLDCDSKAFIEDLKANGRIIVGTGTEFPQKCAASVIIGKDTQIRQLSAKLTEQEEQIKTLNTNLTNAQQAANNSANSVKSQLQQLDSEIKRLQKDNDAIKQQLSDKQNEFNELVDKIRALLPNSKTQKQVPADDPMDRGVSLKKFFRFLPLANFILIAVCICLLLLRNGTPIPTDYAVEELLTQVTQLEKDNKAKDKELKELQASKTKQEQTIAQLISQLNEKSFQAITETAASATATPTLEKDIDCNVTLQNFKQEQIGNNSEINDGESLIIKWEPQTGYTWYAWNLSEDSKEKLKNAANEGSVIVPIKYVKSAPNSESEVIITYRSSERENHCPNNKIKLKIRQQ